MTPMMPKNSVIANSVSEESRALHRNWQAYTEPGVVLNNSTSAEVPEDSTMDVEQVYSPEQPPPSVAEESQTAQPSSSSMPADDMASIAPSAAMLSEAPSGYAASEF